MPTRAARRPGESKVNNFQLAPDVVIAAANHGAIVSSPEGCFRLDEQSATSLMFEVLPALLSPTEGSIGLDPSSSNSVQNLLPGLEQAGIIRRTFLLGARAPGSTDEVYVHVIRQTPLSRRVVSQLAMLGIRSGETFADRSFALADLSGLTLAESLDLTRQAHRAGCRSLPVWRRGAETFYGPLAEPARTACWNCCRLRFSDSLSVSDEASVEDAPEIARTIALNLLMAVRYPIAAAYGCVLIDDGQASSLHSVLPMPWCEICGGAAALSNPRIVPLTHSPHIPEDLRIIAGPRSGVVRHVFLYEGDGTEAPAVPCCSSAVIAPYQDALGMRPASNGEGKGATLEAAVRSAIGEGIERYSASLWDWRAITYTPFRAIADRAFDPRWLVLYEDDRYGSQDFPFAPFDTARPIAWTAARWLDTGEAVQVPALAAYLNFPADSAEQFAQTTSNGLAAGRTLEDAALRALYELIERDAFMLHWLARRPALRVAEDGCEDLTRRALRGVERMGAVTELYLLDVGTGYPTFVCLGLGDGRSWPGVTIGLGTHPNPDIALQRAVFEHGHYGAYIRRLMLDNRHAAVLRSESVTSSLDHALYYVHPGHASALQHFRGHTGKPASLPYLRTIYRQEDTLSACVARLGEAGIRTAAADVTSPDIALAHVHVVRAFGIHMQPLHFGVSNTRLRNPRLHRLLTGPVETNPHPIA